MVGMAVADAVGAPLEFLPVENGDLDVENTPNYQFKSQFVFNNMEYIGPSNKFRLKPGQWTDDASMGFCMADSLLAKNGCYDGSDIRTRFHLWWNFGYTNAFVNDPSRKGSVGLGGNIAMSLDSCRAGEVPTPVFERKNEDAGIGSLMRLAPIPVRYHSNIEDARNFAAQSSLTTHPGLLGAECCAFLSHMIVKAINRDSELDSGDIKEFIDQVVVEYISLLETRMNELNQNGSKSNEETSDEESKTNPTTVAAAAEVDEDDVKKKATLSALKQVLRLLNSSEIDESTERCWNWKSDSLQINHTINQRGRKYNGYPVIPGYFGSFCMDGLAMALWSVYNTTSFDQAVVKCVNLLGDADSTGSIAGQIAGAFYGFSTIDPRFVANLEKWDSGDTALRGALLYSIGNKDTLQKDLKEGAEDSS
jgi:ADP-ribosylglycohydrolase